MHVTRAAAALALISLAGLALASCSSNDVVAPSAGIPESMLSRAVRLHVDVASGTIVTVDAKPSGGASSSLIGADVVHLTTFNFVRTSLNATRDLVRFDVAVANGIPGTTLITPSFPSPPGGVTGLLLFPFSAKVTAGLATGKINPSADWDGPLANFFDTATCLGVNKTCFVYEPFPSVLDGGQSTAARNVGYQIDKTITSFDVYLVLAADMIPTPVGTVAGAVTSPQRGVLPNVTVTVTPAGLAAPTTATGTYTIAGVRAGIPQTVSLSNVPGYCTAPAAQNVTTADGATSTLNFSLICTTAVGTISGVVSSLERGLLANVTVSAGGVSTTTTATGSYSLANVPAGNQTVAVSTLPGNCPAAPSPVGAFVVEGQTTTMNVTVTCAMPSGTITGQVTSPERGALAGVTVGAGGVTGTTNATGNYTLTGVPVGTQVVTVSSLPAFCPNAPAAQNATVVDAQTSTLHFSVTCSPLTGTISGTVSSPLRGLLQGVTVSAVGINAVTDIAGFYVLASVPVGTQTVTVSGVPSPCPTPGQQNAVVLNAQTTTTNFSVACPGGTVTGLISSAKQGNLANVTVSIGGVTGQTNASGVYSLSGIPVGNRTLTVSGVPAVVCTTPASVPLVINDGQTITQNVNVACVTSFTSIAMGQAHTCGLTTKGEAYCWGNNESGQLGDNPITNRSLPALVQGGKVFTSITLGAYHTCGLTALGVTYCWGKNSEGELGDNTTVNRSVPTQVQTASVFTSINAGDRHTCGVTNTPGVSVCWGYNGYGQLGDGTITNRLVPTTVAGGNTFTAISGGASHTCGVLTGGSARCWGYNAYGAIGDGTTVERHTPTPLSSAPPGGFTGLAAGNVHTCGTTVSSVFCWGYNGDGQLGDNTTTTRLSPVGPLVGAANPLTIASGRYHTCAILGSTATVCWGFNVSGQLGNNSIATSPAATAVHGGLVFAKLAAGDYQTCGLTVAGVAYCWGDNDYGQLGDGTTSQRYVPVAVIPP